MNRLLITLLALLTGLAAQVSPAAAAMRPSESAEIGAPHVQQGQLTRNAKAAIDQTRHRIGGQARSEADEASPFVSVTIHRAVMTGSDRALE